MKVCIYGVGGVGGYLACRLHNAGMDVSMVSRGKMLEAIQSKGLKLESPQGDVWMNAVSHNITMCGISCEGNKAYQGTYRCTVFNNDVQSQMQCVSLTVQVFSVKVSVYICTEFVDC